MAGKQVVVITGANRGIGLELTKQALSKGYTVVATTRKPLEATDLKALKSQGGALEILELDIRSDESVQKFAKSLSSTGVERVDVLINNAGVYSDNDSKASNTSVDTIKDTFETNVAGPVRMTQALLPMLKRANGAKVAMLSSLMGSIADNSGGGSPAYRMSKAALNMFAKTLSIDEPSLTVITLHPGWVATRMGGAQAPMQPSASAEGLFNVVANAKHGESGKFLNYAGRELPW